MYNKIMTSTEFFVYNHQTQDFSYETDTRGKELLNIIQSTSVVEIEASLESRKIDALLVLDTENSRWLLVFGGHTGIVGQRTARRQADSIARTGFQIPGKHRIKAAYPLEEISETNIGDLWKTVQQKYVKSSLSGMDLDDELGIPTQIAERKKLLESAGFQDELTKADLEKEESARRKRAMEKTYAVKSQEPSKIVSEKITEPKAVKKIEHKPHIKVSKKNVSAKRKIAEARTKSKGPFFFEAKNVKQYVENNNTVLSIKGDLHKDDDKNEQAILVFKKANIPENEWDTTALFIENGDILQVEINQMGETYHVTSVVK